MANRGGKVEVLTDFLFLGSKITADGDCIHDIRRRLLLDRKPRQCTEKQKYYSADKDPLSQGYSFPVVMYGCKSWIVKKVECLRMDAFKLWCWRRLLKVPWTARKIK